MTTRTLPVSVAVSGPHLLLFDVFLIVFEWLVPQAVLHSLVEMWNASFPSLNVLFQLQRRRVSALRCVR